MFEVPVALWGRSLYETCWMVFGAGGLGILIGGILGIGLYGCQQRHFWYAPWVLRICLPILNLLRSLPFIILLTLLLPAARWLLGSSIGLGASTLR